MQFWTDQGGQFAFLSIVGVIPLLFLTFSIVNSGSAIQDATRTQDAADMVALVHAAEGARSMNTLAMNHVSLTQNFTTAVNSSALDAAINIHTFILWGAIAETAIYAASTCTPRYPPLALVTAPLFAICITPALNYALDLLEEVWRVNDIHSVYRPDRSLRIANRALRALDAQNREIFDRFPEAVSEQAALIAIEHRVEDLYFDESCVRGLAESCDSGDRRQGMELPVTIDQPRAAHLAFCTATLLGTGGIPTGGLDGLLSLIPGLGGIGGVPLMNGSFLRRQFPVNHGPMLGGSESDPFLPLHISRESGIGQALEDYQDMAHDKRLYDGMRNLHLVGIDAADLAATVFANVTLGRSNRAVQQGAQDALRELRNATAIDATSTADYWLGPGFAYPTDQTVEQNIFRSMVVARFGAQCEGGGGTGIIGAGLAGFLDNLSSSSSGGVPSVEGFVQGIGASLLGAAASLAMEEVYDFSVYHPSGQGIVPTIAPGLDDFPYDFKPLAFIYREGNDRWSPVAFTDPNPGFVRYSQALIYNPDEISIYSQNWRARIIPATRMLELNQIISRMQSGAPDAFDEFRSDLQHAQGASGWNRLVTR